MSRNTSSKKSNRLVVVDQDYTTSSSSSRDSSISREPPNPFTRAPDRVYRSAENVYVSEKSRSNRKGDKVTVFQEHGTKSSKR